MSGRRGFERRVWGAVLVPVLLLLVSCAATTPPPRDAPAAPAGVDPAAVPAPPAGTSAAIEAAWLDLRQGSTVAAADDGSPEAHALSGFAALRVGRLDAAASAFRAAMQGRPGFAHASYGMGLVALLQGRDDVARQWFSTALDEDPEMARAAVQLRALALEDVQVALSRAEAAERDGDLVGAGEAYEQALLGAPDVASLYLLLGRVRTRAGNDAQALEILERGRRLAGDEPALLAALGERYLALERFGDAYEVYRILSDLRPDDAAVANLADRARREFESASLPEEYRDLANQQTITREELAAILAIHLEGLRPDGGRPGVFVSDVEDRWSAPFVQRMVEWGVMDAYQNNAFWPDLEVPRSMLVEAAYRVLQVMGVADLAPRPAIQDPPPEHLLYRPVQAMVGLQILEFRSSGSFDLLEPVSGVEAIRAAERLAAAVRRLRS